MSNNEPQQTPWCLTDHGCAWGAYLIELARNISRKALGTHVPEDDMRLEIIEHTLITEGRRASHGG